MSTPAFAAQRVRDGLFAVDPPALLAGRCRGCSTLHFPRRAICPGCQQAEVEETRLSTRGRVYTFTIVRAAPPGYLGETPYAIGIVELPEGLRVTSTITADDLEALAIGDAVEFELIALGADPDGVVSYAFRRQGDQR